MTYLFCAYRDWAIDLYKLISKKHKNTILLKNPKKLTLSYVKKINPKIIFFPDWSWIVPKIILDNYKCVCFHESDLPKFKGGSPIQNQIIRGVKKTKTTAFIMNNKIDSGDILLKKILSLEGTLDKIFQRMIKNDYAMILRIIKGNYKIRKQSGHSTQYKRRKPEESELDFNESKQYIYNFIRMLSDPYPNAFIKYKKHKIVFKSAEFRNGKLSFKGEIE
jgi:methionyl-tRNA formyltransferase